MSLGKMQELVVEWVINTLDNDPDDWVQKYPQYIKHKKGTEVWVGNEWWGVSISDGSICIKHVMTGNYSIDYKMPKVRILHRIGLLPMPETPWRLRVYEAYERWKDREEFAEIAEWLKTR